MESDFPQFGFPSMVRFSWNISQLIFKNLHFGVCGTAVSWNFRYLGVPSDGEKVVAPKVAVELPKIDVEFWQWFERQPASKPIRN